MTLRQCRGNTAVHFLVCGFLVLTFAGLMEAQTNTLFRPRSLQSGARALGFGDAYIADDNDINSMYWNPAALVYLQHTSLVLNHTLDRASNMMNESFATPLLMHKGEVFAMGVMLNHVGRLSESSIANLSALQYGYDAAYAREVVPTFSLGGAINVRYGSAGSGKLWAFSSSIGMFYTPAADIRYGAVLSGLGNGIRYTYDGSTTILTSEHLARDLQIGASMQFPSAGQKAILTLSIANEKVFGVKGLRYKGGAEYVFLQIVALRLGYDVDPDFQVATYGVGLRAGKWQFDYGMLPSRLTDRIYQFTLGFDLWSTGEIVRTDR